MALRAAAHRALQDAAAMAQASRDYGFGDTARRYTALAERFEAARRQHNMHTVMSITPLKE